MSDIKKQMTLEELEKHFWHIAEIGRAEFPRSQENNLYVLSIIFYKRIYDMSLDVFTIPGKNTWRILRNLASHNCLEELSIELNKAFYELERHNPLLQNSFVELNFNRCSFMSSIAGIIRYLDGISFTLENIPIDIMGKAFSWFLDTIFFPVKSNIVQGEMISPPDLIKLVIQILEPKPKEKLYDPTFGSGGFFMETIKYLEMKYGSSKDIYIYGQEINSTAYRICQMKLIMNGIYEANLVDSHCN